LLDKAKPVHSGHLKVCDYEIEGMPAETRFLKHGHGGTRSIRSFWTHSPLPQHLDQDDAVGPVVVHDENGAIAKELGAG
jgi:hypothetical protein